MKIAVPCQGGQIFQHFGHTSQFKLYTVEDGAVAAIQLINTNGSGHGALSAFLVAQNADTVICGGIGDGARDALSQAGIRLYGGAAGDADYAVAMFLAGKLDYNPDARCDHHDHHGDGHSCGEHTCSEHSCGGHHE